MKAKTELIASWLVCISRGAKPFVVRPLECKHRINHEGDLVQYAWRFSTRKKARDFAWQMNAAAHYALD